jgi:glutamyl-tRNA reductase
LPASPGRKDRLPDSKECWRRGRRKPVNPGEAQYRSQIERGSQDSDSPLLVVMGINYHSTPLIVRERLLIPESCLSYALAALADMPHLEEAAILSTCNRTEVFAVVNDVHAGLQEIESFFLSCQRVAGHDCLRPNFKLLRDDVALHLFRVAAGLDSLVLGEGQIMAQVKAAHRKAQDAGTAGPVLAQLFQMSLSCGKRVRTQTSLGRRAVSVSSAAVELARETLGPLAERQALVIGAGRMAQICAKLLLSESGAGQVAMVNRSRQRLENFAANNLSGSEKLNLDGSFENRHELAAGCQLLIVSTGAPDFLITREELARHRDASAPALCIVDISVPRNVEPAVAQLPGVTLFHIDDLSRVVDKNLAEREALTGEAEKIVFESLADFNAWERSCLVAPVIAGLRSKVEAIRAEHLVRHERKFERKHGESQVARKAEFEELSRALINQILHHPTTQLKSTSDYQVLKQQAEALCTLFNLDITGTEGCPVREALKSEESLLS